MRAWRSVFVVVNAAPEPSNACVMSMTIKGSSSTMRIERPSREGPFIRFSRGAAKRKLPEAGGLVRLDRVCPGTSINPHIATKRDDRRGRGKARRAGAARCCVVLTYHAQIGSGFYY